MHLRLENFDGPLDLLVYLIKTQELNVFNIPVSLITIQYLGFLEQTLRLDFDEAGGYLAMAAQLLDIKSQMLIPALQNQAFEAQTLEDIPPEDPRRPLVEQILQHEAIKEAALELEKMGQFSKNTFASGEFKRREEEFDSLEHPIKGNALSLIVAFEKTLLSYAEKKVLPTVKIRAQKITIQKRMEELLLFFSRVAKAMWVELMDICENRYELIVTFMAILELCKSNHLDIIQSELFGPLEIVTGTKFELNLPHIDSELAIPT